eukprot:598123-Rhodomonas_salina.2
MSGADKYTQINSPYLRSVGLGASDSAESKANQTAEQYEWYEAHGASQLISAHTSCLRSISRIWSSVMMSGLSLVAA